MPGTDVAVPEQPDGGALVISQETRELVEAMFWEIPSAEEDGAERLILQLLAADSWEDLNKPWDTTKSEQLMQQQLVIREIMRSPSDYTTGWGHFLVVFATDPRTGEEIVFATGAATACVQLIIAHAKGWFPLVTRLITAERPTKKGHKPQRFVIEGAVPTQRAVPAAAAAADGGGDGE